MRSPVSRVGSIAQSRLRCRSRRHCPMWLARADADVIVLHEPNPMALVAYCLARPQRPLIVWYPQRSDSSEAAIQAVLQPLLEFALRRAARIVVASPPMLRRFPRSRSISANASSIPYGLERTTLPARLASPGRECRRSGRTSPRRSCCSSGGSLPYKGVDVLLKAVQGLDALDGDRRGRALRACRSPHRPATLGLGDRVRFMGEVSDDDLLAWYHACDVLVLPSVSRQEAFGMVQLEAMLCGHPVISTELQTGTSWVNQHERTGLVVKPGNVGELRDALAAARAVIPSSATEFGDAGSASGSSRCSPRRRCAGRRCRCIDEIRLRREAALARC